MKRLVEIMGFDFSCVLASKSSVLSFFSSLLGSFVP